jgi:hypothetical protein
MGSPSRKFTVPNRPWLTLIGEDFLTYFVVFGKGHGLWRGTFGGKEGSFFGTRSETVVIAN